MEVVFAMEIDGITPAGVSDKKLLETQQDAQVRVLKKQLEGEGSVKAQLIEGATDSGGATRPGVGDKLNVVA